MALLSVAPTTLKLPLRITVKDYEITESYFKTWGQPVKRKRMMLFGFQQFALDVPQLLCGTLKNSLGHHFNETTKMVNCPCGFTTDSSEELFIEYVDRNEAYLKKGIQALILNFLRYFRPSEYKVSVFDYIHYNADILGPLSALANGKNSIIEKTASDSKSLKQNIAILADYYRKVESKLGTLTLFQYNKQQKPEYRIPFRILIINRSEEVFRASDDPEMSYIVNNAEKFGITIIHKVYCLPSMLNKGNAIERFAKKFGEAISIAAGDSEFDIPMLARADTRIIPPVLEQYLPTENTITISTSVFSDGICNYLSTIAKRGTHKHE